MIIQDIYAISAYNSRGLPTIGVKLTSACGASAIAYAPSGASVGQAEAIELLDADDNYWHGKGVKNAVEKINRDIREKLIDNQINTIAEFDEILLGIDQSPQKNSIGGNTTTALSIAFARVLAAHKNIPLYRLLMEQNNSPLMSIPVPMMNIINGGAHANNSLDIQEFMIMPRADKILGFQEQMRACSEIYQTLKQQLDTSKYSTCVGDEGGFAPSFDRGAKQALDFILKAIETSGYIPDDQIQLTLDVAASELYENGQYSYEGRKLNSSDYVAVIKDLADNYPISSIEDPAAEDDWDTWKMITEELGDKTQIVGDDVFVTQSDLLQKGIDAKVANAILIKINQVGTLSETLDTIKMAERNNYKCVISHRSGDTEDTFIADLAVATNAGAIKTGAPCRSERVAKYNRLLWIEKDQAT